MAGANGHGVAEQEPTEVAALVESIAGDILTEQDPLIRYLYLTREQGLYQGVVNAISEARAAALADLHGSGLSYAQISAAVGGIGRARVQQLVERARTVADAKD